VRGLLLAWTPREDGQRHAEFATFGELHTSSGHPTAIGSRRLSRRHASRPAPCCLSPNAAKHRPGTSPRKRHRRTREGRCRRT
jgi:hypothetical protein